MTAATGQVQADVSGYKHGRVPRAVREQQILREAENLFAEEGFSGASMDELSRRAGISKPVVYALFGSKEALYRRCVERMATDLASEIIAAAGTESDPGSQLRAASLAFFHFVANHRRLWEALAWDPGPFAEDAAAIRRGQDELVATLFSATASRFGAAPESRKVTAMAQAVNGAVEALARWWRDHGDVPAEELTQWVVELLLPGLEELLARA